MALIDTGGLRRSKRTVNAIKSEYCDTTDRVDQPPSGKSRIENKKLKNNVICCVVLEPLSEEIVSVNAKSFQKQVSTKGSKEKKNSKVPLQGEKRKPTAKIASRKSQRINENIVKEAQQDNKTTDLAKQLKSAKGTDNELKKNKILLPDSKLSMPETRGKLKNSLRVVLEPLSEENVSIRKKFPKKQVSSKETNKKENAKVPLQEAAKTALKRLQRINENVNKEVEPGTSAKEVDKLKKAKMPSPASKLRKRKTMNYAESSFELSREVHPKKKTVNKVPIYKLNVDNKKVKPKQQEDTYEFDSDSEERREKKKRRKLNDSSFHENNKLVQGAVKNVKRQKNRPKKNNNNVKVIKPKAVNVKKNHQVAVVKQNKKVNFDQVQKPDSIRETNMSDLDNNNFQSLEMGKRNLPKIQVISNVRLGPNTELDLTIPTPTKFREERPDANSTMINNVFTPWRFNDINIKRNPHLIKLKESSLPSINQEMVLDHTLVDKLGEQSKYDSTNVTRRNIEGNKKSPVQKRVTDYFSFDDKENTHQVSLFDDDLFSPIKSNKSPFVSKVGSVKRKILGEKNDNVCNSTPKQGQAEKEHSSEHLSELYSGKENHEEVNKNVSYFGFDSDVKDDEPVTPRKAKDNKPFRLSININDKKYTRKPKHIKKKFQVVPVESSSDDESDCGSLSETQYEQVGLFEDFHDSYVGDISQEPLTIKKKRRKRVCDNGEHPYHVKRKDMRTREEEEEAEKWAAAFNSMCQEIEEFPLEIE